MSDKMSIRHSILFGWSFFCSVALFFIRALSKLYRGAMCDVCARIGDKVDTLVAEFAVYGSSIRQCMWYRIHVRTVPMPMPFVDEFHRNKSDKRTGHHFVLHSHRYPDVRDMLYAIVRDFAQFWIFRGVPYSVYRGRTYA